jgi:hypothetical protein
MERQSDPDLIEGNQGCHQRRPQAGEQEDAAYNRNRVLCEDGWPGRTPRKTVDTPISQSGAETASEQQQAKTRPTAWKG